VPLVPQDRRYIGMFRDLVRLHHVNASTVCKRVEHGVVEQVDSRG